MGTFRKKTLRSRKLRDVLALAETLGLLSGTRTTIVCGRVPEALVNQAGANTGIQSNTELIEVALANLAVADDYPEWLLSQRSFVSRNLDLEF